MPKSRYDSVSLYISEDAMHRPEYNDIDAPFDAEIKKQLMDGGIDDRLAHHISHLFIRDPLVIFSETLDQDDEVETDHFEVRCENAAAVARYADAYSFFAMRRTYNPRTGSLCVSNLRPPTRRSAGGSNSAAWRSS